MSQTEEMHVKAFLKEMCICFLRKLSLGALTYIHSDAKILKIQKKKKKKVRLKTGIIVIVVVGTTTLKENKMVNNTRMHPGPIRKADRMIFTGFLLDI